MNSTKKAMLLGQLSCRQADTVIEVDLVSADRGKMEPMGNNTTMAMRTSARCNRA
jgi:hypothetical protein